MGTKANLTIFISAISLSCVGGGDISSAIGAWTGSEAASGESKVWVFVSGVVCMLYK